MTFLWNLSRAIKEKKCLGRYEARLADCKVCDFKLDCRAVKRGNLSGIEDIDLELGIKRKPNGKILPIEL